MATLPEFLTFSNFNSSLLNLFNSCKYWVINSCLSIYLLGVKLYAAIFNLTLLTVSS